MNSDEKTTLSALIDGATESLEERRFLRDHDPAVVVDTVARWQLIGNSIRGSDRLAVEADLKAQPALFHRIQAEIASETKVISPLAHEGSPARKPWVLGLAASVLIVALAAFIIPSLQVPAPTLESSQASLAVPIKPEQSVALASFNVTGARSTDFDEMNTNPDLKVLDAVGRAQLRAYLKQHDELSQLGSRQVFVNYPSSTSSN